MVSVVGPAFSLAASGKLGDALFYYDTKFGARVRVPKRRFTPPGNVWVVNQSYFEAASDRAKTLNRWQKLAWRQAYPLICDNWRDIFMGKQIEFWNLSPLNDLTWPPISCPDIGIITFGHGIEFVGSVQWWMDEFDVVLVKKWTVCALWWNKLDNAGAPDEDDIVAQTSWGGYDFTLEAGHTNYLWGGVRYLNGNYKTFFLDSYVR